MTWAQWKAATQLLAEESPVGAPARAKQLAEQAAEEAQVEATKAAIRKYAPKVEVAAVNGSPQVNTPAVIPPRPITTEIVGA